MKFYGTYENQTKRQEKFKFITLNLITVEIRIWIRDFSWLFEIKYHWLRIKT